MFAVAPVIFNFDEQFQVTTMAEHLFDVVAGAHADVFQARRAVANDNFLLRRPLDKDRAVNTNEILAHLFPLFGDHRGYVRNLFACLFKNLLAHNFRGQYPDRLLASFPWRSLQVLRMDLHSTR